MKLRIVGMLLAACVLTACDENGNSLNGQLDVSAPLTIKDKSGKTQTLPAAAYATSLKMTDKGSAIVVKKGSTEITMVMPKVLKELQGEFTVTAAEIKQTFSINGNVELQSGQTDTSHSGSCVYSYSNEYVCRSYMIAPDRGDRQDNGDRDSVSPGTPPDSDRPQQDHPNEGGRGGDDSSRGDGGYEPPRETCGYENVPVYGSQWIQETSEVTDKVVTMELVDARSGQAVAVFGGTARVSKRVISSYPQGSCTR